MEVQKAMLAMLSKKTSCQWTSGYLQALLDSSIPPAEAKATALIEAAGADNKILAIKDMRAEFGLPLKEAKAVVDEYYASGRIKSGVLRR